MDKQLAIEKQNQLKISVVQIVREEYEMVLLNRIFESGFGNRLVFRGGTALRLAYGSPRFSDDLDFTQLQEIELEKFNKWCEEIARSNPNLKLVEALGKYYTLYAKFTVIDPVLVKPIGIKIEISQRKGEWIRGKDYVLIQLSSEVTPLTALAQVATVERIEQEKQSILPKRIRDIFDLWFMGQKLKKSTPMDFSNFKTKEVRQELHRLLPEGEWQVLKQWLPN